MTAESQSIDLERLNKRALAEIRDELRLLEAEARKKTGSGAQRFKGALRSLGKSPEVAASRELLGATAQVARRPRPDSDCTHNSPRGN